jgi:acyl dehydratase
MSSETHRSELAFADIAVGMAIPATRHGLFSTSHQMRWSAGIENWHRIHYDQAFAQGHDGLDGLVISGSWKQHALINAVWRWVRPTGWISEVKITFVRPNFVGETLETSGTVTAVESRLNLGFVTCEVQMTNEAAEVSTKGVVVAVLPLERDAVVPLPYSPAGR